MAPGSPLLVARRSGSCSRFDFGNGGAKLSVVCGAYDGEETICSSQLSVSIIYAH